jgi:hypothetical protein
MGVGGLGSRLIGLMTGSIVNADEAGCYLALAWRLFVVASCCADLGEGISLICL